MDKNEEMEKIVKILKEILPPNGLNESELDSEDSEKDYISIEKIEKLIKKIDREYGEGKITNKEYPVSKWEKRKQQIIQYLIENGYIKVLVDEDYYDNYGIKPNEPNADELVMKLALHEKGYTDEEISKMDGRLMVRSYNRVISEKESEAQFQSKAAFRVLLIGDPRENNTHIIPPMRQIGLKYEESKEEEYKKESSYVYDKRTTTENFER